MMTREKDVAINSVCCELPCRGTGPQSTRGLVRTLCGRVCGNSASHRCLLYPHVSGFVCRHATQAADIINELCVSARNEWGVTSSQQVGWENYPHVRHAPQERTHLPSLDGLSPWSFSFYYCYTPTVLTTRAEITLPVLYLYACNAFHAHLPSSHGRLEASRPRA